jgi:hypothetical protein
MKKETKLQAAFKDLNKEMRKLWFCSMGISSFLLTCTDRKAYSLHGGYLKESIADKCVMNCEKWKILFGLWVIDVPSYVSYHKLEERWFSVRQFRTLYRMPEKTFFAYRDLSN